LFRGSAYVERMGVAGSPGKAQQGKVTVVEKRLNGNLALISVLDDSSLIG
jgi:hypothetical protein